MDCLLIIGVLNLLGDSFSSLSSSSSSSDSDELLSLLLSSSREHLNSSGTSYIDVISEITRSSVFLLFTVSIYFLVNTSKAETYFLGSKGVLNLLTILFSES